MGYLISNELIIQWGLRYNVGTNSVKGSGNIVTLPISYLSDWIGLITCASGRIPMYSDADTNIPGISGKTLSDFGICYSSTVSYNANFYWITIGF